MTNWYGPYQWALTLVISVGWTNRAGTSDWYVADHQDQQHVGWGPVIDQ